MKIAILPGDGIGPEITAATLEILQLLEGKLALGLRFETHEVGFASLERSGTTLPEKVIEACRAADGFILGPADSLA